MASCRASTTSYKYNNLLINVIVDEVDGSSGWITDLKRYPGGKKYVTEI